jgi:hypothetical protein
MAINHPSEIQKFEALALFSAAKLYVKTGISANTAYTPKNMMRAASDFTGMDYTRLDDVVTDLRLWFSDICSLTVDDEPIAYAED